MSKRKFLFVTTALTPILIAVMGGASVHAQAVSAPNATLGGFGGVWLSDPFGSFEGRFTAPLGSNIGAQLDGIAWVAGGEFGGQVAGHLFMRDPANGLLGAYAAFTAQNGGSDFRFGPEAELYLGDITFSGVGGLVIDNGANDGSDDFFGQAKALLYVEPNTNIFGGYVYEGASYFNAGFEHLFGSGVTGFGEARFGQNQVSGWLGVRFYLGGNDANNKTLIDRERQDVAPLWLHIVDKPRHVPAPGGT